MPTLAKRTAAQVGQDIADEIEQRGHLQLGNEFNATPKGSGAPACCVVTAQAFPMNDFKEFNDFLEALYAKLNLSFERDAQQRPAIIPATRWNDRTPTEVVLETLRSL